MWPCLKLRIIEQFIQELDVFTKPKILYEQYPTPPHIASHMLHTMQACYGDITSKIVADLGCGSGVLTLSSALMDANLAVGFEIDNDALDIFTKNVNEHEIENIEAIQCDVLNISNRWNKMFDTVVMNPPFGTKKNAGMDMKFLKKALELSNNVVYSLHKTSTRDHVLKVGKQYGAHGTVLANLVYDIPATYRFHKKSSVDINVDFVRFVVNTN